MTILPRRASCPICHPLCLGMGERVVGDEEAGAAQVGSGCPLGAFVAEVRTMEKPPRQRREQGEENNCCSPYQSGGDGRLPSLSDVREAMKDRRQPIPANTRERRSEDRADDNSHSPKEPGADCADEQANGPDHLKRRATEARPEAVRSQGDPPWRRWCRLAAVRRR